MPLTSDQCRTRAEQALTASEDLVGPLDSNSVSAKGAVWANCGAGWAYLAEIAAKIEGKITS